MSKSFQGYSWIQADFGWLSIESQPQNAELADYVYSVES